MEDADHRISRRTALKLLGGTGLVVAVGPHLVEWDATSSVLSSLRSIASGAIAPSLLIPVFRREDLLSLRFELYNLRLDTSGAKPMLVPVSEGFPSWLVAVLPFQSIAEYADVVSATPPSSWPDTPVESLAAGPSQLAFLVPRPIPYTLESLTDWGSLSEYLPAVSVHGGAAPATNPVYEPTTTKTPPVTYIEMAWRLLVAPDPASRWDSPPEPIADDTDLGTFTELWQARRHPVGASPSSLVYAVWTPGYAGLDSVPTTDPLTTSLTDGSGFTTTGTDAFRIGLVNLSSQPTTNLPAGHGATAKTLMVTPLGVTADVQGTYDSSLSSIISWTHRMSIGRDTYVRVVLAGYLYPFGNRAVKIQTTDREFQVSPSGDTVAYLVQRTTVQVTQPVVVYPYPDTGAEPQPNGGRQNPFVSIEIKTLDTPPLDPNGTAGNPGAPGVNLNNGSHTVPDSDATWINVDGRPFAFACVGTDSEGRTIDFTTYGIWVDESVTNDQSVINDIAFNYENAPSPSGTTNFWRTAVLGGQLVALAPPSSFVGSQPGATALHIDSMVLDTSPWIANDSETSPPWYLTMSESEGAMVRLPAVAALTATGSNDSGPGTQVVFEKTTYLPSGPGAFPANSPQVFLTFPTVEPLNFTQGTTGQSAQTGTSQSGGVVAPNFNIDGFAADKGPVSDAANLLMGAFDPSTFFAGLDAKILGVIPLADILQLVTAGPMEGPDNDDDDPSPNDQTPQIQSVPIYTPGQTAPTALKTTIDWAPTVTAPTSGPFEGWFDPGDPNGFYVHVTILAPLQPPGPPTSTIDGQLSDFTINLFGDGAAECVSIHFVSVQFSQRTGAKSNVQVNVDTVTFEGALSFIETFEELFSSLGGPQIDVEPTGITASYSVSLPSIGLGVFALENISLGGALNLPFTGQPIRLNVNFCTRENPFLLTIYFFTGGGWFLVSLGADGIEMVEVGLEFGASISLDLGVASGGVTVAAGIYFALGSGTVTLTGFFQASGSLEVLGIISISIVFYLGLTYQSPPAAAYGTASVSVTVSVLCFSASVTLTVTKQLAGSDPPIPFADAIAQTDWANYCAAFA